MANDYEEFITDREVAKLLKVSQSTVRRLVYAGPDKAGRFDLRLCEPIVIGGARRWPLRKLYGALGISC